MEVMIKSNNKPHHNVADIYLLNTQAIMQFLHKNDLTIKSFDNKKLNINVNKLSKRFLDYKIKYEPDFELKKSQNYKPPVFELKHK